MSSLAAATLARAGVAEVVVANRTLDRAERLAQILTDSDETDVLARAVPIDSVPVELTRADVAVSCTGATGLVLTAESVAAAVEGRTAPVADARRAATGAADSGRTADVALGRTGRPAAHQCRQRRRLPARPVRRAGHRRASPCSARPPWPVWPRPSWNSTRRGWTTETRRTAPAARAAVLDPEADADAIAALAAAAATVGRVPERRRPEPVAEVPRPAARARAARPRHAP